MLKRGLLRWGAALNHKHARMDSLGGGCVLAFSTCARLSMRAGTQCCVCAPVARRTYCTLSECAHTAKLATELIGLPSTLTVCVDASGVGRRAVSLLAAVLPSNDAVWMSPQVRWGVVGRGRGGVGGVAFKRRNGFDVSVRA